VEIHCNFYDFPDNQLTKFRVFIQLAYPGFLSLPLKFLQTNGRTDVSLCAFVRLFDGVLQGIRTIRWQTNSRSVKSRTSQLAEMFYVEFGVFNRSVYDIKYIILCAHC